MRSRALLLGFYSIGGQVLLLRELVASLNGDELFISTALFGWLASVAIGAYFGGTRRFQADPTRLFAVGTILLPVTIVGMRLSPGITGHMIGEVIPFTTAALISIVMMLPVGLVSGWLFPSVAIRETRVRTSIVHAYLFEGIGAFAGGLGILLLVGDLLSALQTAAAIGLAVVTVSLVLDLRKWLVKGALLIAGGTIIYFVLPPVMTLESWLDQSKYKPWVIEEVFDTHYGRQTILSREGELTLLTDNTVEAVYPELSTAENQVIPPVVYHPEAERILYVGRAEFGVAQLADSLGAISVTAVDLRGALTKALDRHILSPFNLRRIDKDLFAYVSSAKSEREWFDAIVVNIGSLDSYKGSRFLTPFALRKLHSLLASGGVLLVCTTYDTDSYIGSEEGRLLSTIYNVVLSDFNFTDVWPGHQTLILASDSSLFNIPFDSILARLESFSYQPQFVSGDYLADRLHDFKRDRLLTAVHSSEDINSVNQPLLPYLQALFRSKANSVDHAIISQIFTRSKWTLAVPIIVIALFVGTIASRKARGKFALFLFFVAGFVSLSLELISFYVYQSYSGSLYSEMAVLIGAFMLGLAAGTYYASRADRSDTAHIALFVLFVVTIAFEMTYAAIPTGLTLLYHTLFLLISAAATGALFAAATRRYYGQQSRENRGLGYALEIAGSSVGALFSTTVLLPIIGLSWLLIGIAAVIGLAYVGLLLSP